MAAEGSGANEGVRATPSNALEVEVTEGEVAAGKQLIFKPEVRDVFGNLATIGDDQVLSICAELPGGDKMPLELVTHQAHDHGRDGSGSSPRGVVRFMPLQTGQYSLAATLDGGHISGSPLAFTVVADKPAALCSEVTIRPQGGADDATVTTHTGTYVAGEPHEVRLAARDKVRCPPPSHPIALGHDEGEPTHRPPPRLPLVLPPRTHRTLSLCLSLLLTVRKQLHRGPAGDS